MKKNVSDFESFIATSNADAPTIGSLAKELLAKGVNIEPKTIPLYYAINELVTRNHELTERLQLIEKAFVEYIKNPEKYADQNSIQSLVGKLGK